MRRARSGEELCLCGAYRFPHRQFGGKCSLEAWVERFWSPGRSDCADCLNRDGSECQVVTGQEQPAHCPELRGHIRYHGMVLYGRAAALYARAQNRGGTHE
jgi:hypothetical protein